MGKAKLWFTGADSAHDMEGKYVDFRKHDHSRSVSLARLAEEDPKSPFPDKPNLMSGSMCPMRQLLVST